MIEQNNDKFNQEGHSSIKQIKHRKKWEIQQTFKYCQFIQNNRQTLEFSQKKLKQRIYNKMAEYIGTRSTHQCRSHHQKVLKRHSTIDQFIKAFKGKTQKAKQGKVGENQQKLNDSIQKNLNQEKNIRKLNLGQFQRGVQSNQNVLTSQKSGPFKSNASFSKKQGTENQIKPEINFNPTQLGSIPINKAPVGHPNFHPYNQNENLKIPNFVQLGLNKNLQNPKTSLKANQKMRKNIIVQPNKINVETYGQKEGNEKKTFHHNIQKCNMINENSNEKWEIKSQNVVQNQKGDKNQQGIQKQNNFQNAGFLKNSPIIGSLPPYIALSNTLKFLMSHSNWICESILKNQNLNIINPLIQQNLLQLTEKKIQIFGNQDEYYRIWIEYVKAEQQNSSMESMEQSESQAVSEPTDDDLRRRIRRIFNQTLIEYGLMLNCYPEEFVSDEVNFYLPEQDKIFMPRHPNNTEMHEQTPPWQRGFTPLSPNNRFRECLSALKVHQSEYTNFLERIRQNKIAQQMKSETVKKEDCEIQSSLKQIILQSHPEQVLKDRKDQKKGGDLAQTRDSQEQEQEKPVFGFQTKKPNNDLVPTRDSDSSESNYLNREKMNGQKYQILNINLQQYNESQLFEGRNNQIGSTFTKFSNRGETEIKKMESDISEKVNSN